MRFGWSDLYRGNRFWTPVSESSLLEAGRVAGLSEGMTLLETACGNGAASVFLAEAFHLYARGAEGIRARVETARALAGRSPAARRVRFFHDEPSGPADALCCLRQHADRSLVRAGGPIVWGRYRSLADPVSAEDCFPDAGPPRGECVWRHESTPLEWERFLAPQERALRRYRRALKRRDDVSPVALEAQRRIDRFRSSQLTYEMTVFRLTPP